MQLYIANSSYIGYIIKGETAKSDWQNFDKIVKEMKGDIIPGIVKLFDGQIVAVNESYNA